MKSRSSAAVLFFIISSGSLLAVQSSAQDPLADPQRDYNAGHYHRAVDGLTSAIGHSPNDSSLQFLLGKTYYQLRDYTRAIASLERSVQLLPNQSEYHDWLGRAYGRKAEESLLFSAMSWAKKAHGEFETAVQLQPTNFEAQRDLIRYEMNAPGIVGGGDDRAMKRIHDLEKIDGEQAQLALGEFYITKKRMAEGETVFAKLLASNSARAGVYFEVADYYRDRQNAAKMEEAVTAAQRIDPQDRRLKFYRAVFLVMEKRESAEAESLLRSYIATVPDNADLPPHSLAREWQGKLYESQGRFSEATAAYKAALALDPHNKELEEALKRVEKR
jgi:cytochrome c-type biogenesis protein CcmH/NrfG